MTVATEFGLETRRTQQAAGVLTRLEQRRPVHQRLGGVPHNITDCLTWVHSQQMLQDAEKWDLLWRVRNL